MRFILSLQLVVILCLTSCAGMGGGSTSAGNDAGTAPINEKEEKDYKRAINKCYKTGGSRVVKIEGQLMCY